VEQVAEECAAVAHDAVRRCAQGEEFKRLWE
jgi:hypothetical protein